MLCVSMLPLVEMDDFASFNLLVSRSTRIKFIPWEAHSLETARPTPDAAPVMRAVAFARKTCAAADILTVKCEVRMLVRGK